MVPGPTQSVIGLPPAVSGRLGEIERRQPALQASDNNPLHLTW